MKFFKIENNENLQANLFSFAVHLALFLIMIFSVGWQTKTPNYAEVELWDSVPVQKKIKKTQAKPKQKIIQNNKAAEAKAKEKVFKNKLVRPSMGEIVKLKKELGICASEANFRLRYGVEPSKFERELAQQNQGRFIFHFPSHPELWEEK